MSVIEGTPWHCYIHDFTTPNLDEWNTHCYGNPEHTDQGETACTTCGVKIIFTDLPWHKLAADGSKNIRLQCVECETKMVGQVKRSKIIE